MTAHRALPLVEVERRAREARKPWPAHSCTNGCHTSVCDCTPAPPPGCDAPEFLADPPRPRPPAVPWRELGAGLLVLLFTLAAVHVVATVYRAAPTVAAR